MIIKIDFPMQEPVKGVLTKLKVSATCGRNICGSDRSARPINQTPPG